MSLYDEYIKRCDDVLNSESGVDCDGLLKEAKLIFYRELHYDRVLFELTDASDVPTLKAWLIKKKELQEHELAIAQANAGQVSVSAVSESSALATADVTLNNTMAQVWGLSDDDLGIDQKKELSELLQELENSKGKGESKIVKAAKAVADWAFENAVKAIPTVMPYISQVINGL